MHVRIKTLHASSLLIRYLALIERVNLSVTECEIKLEIKQAVITVIIDLMRLLQTEIECFCFLEALRCDSVIFQTEIVSSLQSSGQVLKTFTMSSLLCRRHHLRNSLPALASEEVPTERSRPAPREGQWLMRILSAGKLLFLHAQERKIKMRNLLGSRDARSYSDER